MTRSDFRLQRTLGLFKTSQCTIATGSLLLLHKLDMWDGAWWWSAFFLACSGYHIAEVLMLEWTHGATAGGEP